MILSFVKKDKIQNYNLPSKIDGSYWINDDTNDNMAINIEAINGYWVLKTDGIEVINNDSLSENIVLKEYNFYYIKTEEEPLILYCSPDYDNTFSQFLLKGDSEIIVGSDQNNHISIKSNYISPKHFKLTYSKGTWEIEDLNSKYKIYVNNNTTARKKLYPGDIIFAMGLKIIIVGNFILVNNPNNTVTINQKILLPLEQKKIELSDQDFLAEEKAEKMYKEDDYFLRVDRAILTANLFDRFRCQ